MEKIMMMWDEIDDLRTMVPRVLTGIAAIALIIAATFVDRLWPI